MIRNATAHWEGNLKEGKGSLTTASNILKHGFIIIIILKSNKRKFKFIQIFDLKCLNKEYHK